MRLLHTSDWHLGRQFYNVSLLDDQAIVLDQILAIAAEHDVDAMIIAGDVYDRSVPPSAATALFDDVLTRCSRDLGIPVIITSGNHDGAERLGFGARVFERSRIYIRSRIDAQPVKLEDEHGPVWFHCLPFADPARVSSELERPLSSHNEAMTALSDSAREVASTSPKGTRHVLITHCFVAGGNARDSERPLSVGGAESVSVSCFAGFDYTALGHLHSPQAFANGRVRYSGSPLKYSFSESGDSKSVTLVDLDDSGAVKTQTISLRPRRDLRIVEGLLDDLLTTHTPVESRDDYLLVRLDDTRALLDVMAQLRTVYPNVLHVERPALMRVSERARPHGDDLRRGELPMFADFFEQMTGEKLSDDALSIIAKALAQLHQAES